MRGQNITDPELLKRWNEMTGGWPLNNGPLRLIPYMVYVWTNDQKVDRRKITPEEYNMLKLWEEKGLITFNGRTRPKKEFWDLCNDILYQSYVIYEEK